MRLFKYRRSLAFSIMLSVLLIFSAGQGFAWVWFLFNQKYHNYLELKTKALVVSDSISGIYTSSTNEKCVETARLISERFVKDEDISSIKLIDNQERQLFHVFSNDYKSSDENSVKSGNPLYVPRYEKVMLPVTMNGSIAGTIEVVLSGDRTNQKMLSLITVPTIVEGLIFLIVVVSIYVFFKAQVTGPINVMRKKIDKIVEGDLTERIPKFGSEELDAISTGLNYLIENLYYTVQRIDSAAESVNTTIKELNETFTNTVKSIKVQADSIDGTGEMLKHADLTLGEINKSTGTLRAVSAENLSSLLEMKASGEETAHSMNALFHASEKSYYIIKSMLENSKTIAEDARAILSSVESTSASLEELTASVRDVESSAKDSSKIAEEVKNEAAQKGIAVVDEAIRGMDKITEKVRFSVEQIRRLDARSNDVQKMLSVIHEVTEQTNLLSLNAAILAEQAGEYGKGFSVVAEQMRELSDKTAVSTKDITGIIKTIQKEIKEIVSSIESGMQFVKAGSDSVYRAGETMSNILDSAHESANMTRSIEQATEEQASSLEYVSESIININNMAIRMSKAMNEQLEHSSYVIEHISDVKDISESTRKGAEEQSLGTGHITRNMELTNEKVEYINESVQNQLDANMKITDALDGIRVSGIRTINDITLVSFSLKRLQNEFSELRKEMSRLRL